MSAPYDHEALWIKAKLFLNRAMDDDARSFDEQALWASLALELLGKAALARVSPLLIAEPSEDGSNLLIASGLLAGDARFKSVSASTVFKRCHKAFKPFDSVEAMKFANARNEYLHGSGTGFMALPPQAWWPRFWAQAVILVNALDRDVFELVGGDREDVVARHLEQNSKNIEHRTEALIERARQRLQQHREGSLLARVAAEWRKGTSDLTLQLGYRAPEPCPACGNQGLLEGDEVLDGKVEYVQESEEDFSAYATVTVGSQYFSCPTCRLVLDSYELIKQAGLAEDFEADDDNPAAFEPEYGND